ncbi:MAG: hypothetical protein ABIA76_03835 [Candidatus Diapherotrites archaeon]
MGIYDDKAFGFGFGYDKPKQIGKMLLLLLLTVILIFAVFYALTSVFTPKPIQLWFEKNPIKSNEEVWLYAKITNTTGFNAENVPISAEALGTKNIILSVQNNGRAESMAPEEKREIKILINPLEEKILEGEYRIKVTANIGSNEFAEEIKLKVEK